MSAAMWWFWILAGTMAAGAALLVSTAAAAAAAARRAATLSADDADVGMHRRQLDELDDLASRDLIAPGELASARTEAARRLLAAADHAPKPERVGNRGSRLLATAIAAAAALLALGLYLKLGAPSLTDAPYARRVAAWRHADPSALSPAALAAVLNSLATERPGDPRVFEYLGRAELAAGQVGAAATAFEHAGGLDRRNADYPAEAGEALLQGGQGRIPPEAQAAFREALARDPKNPAARYHLARARIAAGDLAGGLAQWRALLVDLAADDPRQPILSRAIAEATSPTRATPPEAARQGIMPDRATVQAAAGALATPSDRMGFIHAMVARQAARLRERPDDAAGWARLVHAYRVLGEPRASAAALAQARHALAGQPQALAMVEAQAPPAAP